MMKVPSFWFYGAEQYLLDRHPVPSSSTAVDVITKQIRFITYEQHDNDVYRV